MVHNRLINLFGSLSANMLLLYFLGICLAVNTSISTPGIDRFLCPKSHYQRFVKRSINELIPAQLVNRQEEESARIEIIKQKILQKLGLGRIPSIDEQTTNKIISTQLFDLIDDEDDNLQSNLKTKQSSDQSNSDQIASFIKDEPIDQIYLFPIKSKDDNKFLFNLTMNSERKLSIVQQAKNYILTLRKRDSNESNKKCIVTVYRQTSIEFSDNLNKLGILDENDQKSETNSLIKYNLNSLLHSTLKTDVGLTFPDEELLLYFDTTNCSFESSILIVEYETLQKERTKRSIDCAPNQTGCCREQFYVNFTTIGWHNWILQPAGYDAFYCNGKCDISHARYHYTTLSYKFPNVITQCCSPAAMGPISLIYLDENNYVFKKNLPNMVVERCDCA